MAEILEGREVIFEFTPMGNIMRVMAMDTATATEVTVQVPVHASEAICRQHALKRLEYVLRKAGRL